jgi:glycine cleavage system H protein
MNVPDDLLYTVEHEWVRRLDETSFRIGITDYAQDQLGDVVYVELPEVGKTVGQGELMAEIESTKSVGEVYAPFAGTIVSTNTAAADDPMLVNSSPYEQGWLVEMETDGSALPDNLLDAPGYRGLTE